MIDTPIICKGLPVPGNISCSSFHSQIYFICTRERALLCAIGVMSQMNMTAKYMKRHIAATETEIIWQARKEKNE